MKKLITLLLLLSLLTVFFGCGEKKGKPDPSPTETAETTKAPEVKELSSELKKQMADFYEKVKGNNLKIENKLDVDGKLSTAQISFDGNIAFSNADGVDGYLEKTDKETFEYSKDVGGKWIKTATVSEIVYPSVEYKDFFNPDNYELSEGEEALLTAKKTLPPENVAYGSEIVMTEDTFSIIFRMDLNGVKSVSTLTFSDFGKVALKLPEVSE